MVAERGQERGPSSKCSPAVCPGPQSSLLPHQAGEGNWGVGGGAAALPSGGKMNAEARPWFPQETVTASHLSTGQTPPPTGSLGVPLRALPLACGHDFKSCWENGGETGEPPGCPPGLQAGLGTVNHRTEGLPQSLMGRGGGGWSTKSAGHRTWALAPWPLSPERFHPEKPSLRDTGDILLRPRALLRSSPAFLPPPAPPPAVPCPHALLSDHQAVHMKLI